MDVRICPQCNAEYRPHIDECPACEVPTQAFRADSAFEAGPGLARPERASDLPRGTEVTPIREADLDWCQGLADFLGEHGVPSRIVSPHGDDCTTGGCNPRYLIAVRPQDLSRAAELDRAYLRQQVPEGDAYVDAMPDTHCPACGMELGPNQLECPECGLVVGPLPGEEEEEGLAAGAA